MPMSDPQSPAPPLAPPTPSEEDGARHIRRLKTRYAVMLVGFFALPAIYYLASGLLDNFALPVRVRDTLFIVILSVEGVIAYFTLHIGYLADVTQYHVAAVVKEFDDMKEDLTHLKEFLRRLKPLLPEFTRLMERVDPEMLRPLIREASDHLAARTDPAREAKIREAAARARTGRGPPGGTG